MPCQMDKEVPKEQSSTSIVDENGTEVCSRSGAVWSLKGDLYAKSLEVDNSVAATTLIANWFKIICSRTYS